MNRQLRVPEAHAEAFAFFAIFARFEFALKNLGHLQRLESGALKGGRPMADWSVILRTPQVQNLFGKLRVDDRVMYLLARPPGREVMLLDGGIGFDPPEEVKNMDDLFYAVQRVRNNLFHGGKKPNGTERDRQLLAGAIVVLETILLVCEDTIWYEFEGRY